MSFLDSVWNFIKNHKKKLLALLLTCAVGVGGFYFMKRALLAKLAEVGEIGKALEQKRRKEMELARLRSECTSTVTTYLFPLRRQLHRLTDVVPTTTQLKELRARQKARKALGRRTEEDIEDEKNIDRLWEELKVLSLARLLTSVYALTLIDLLLRVQLHVAAKKALDERGKGEENRVTPKVREQFMFKATDFFVSQGLNTLLQRVISGIKVAAKSWSMGSEQVVTRKDISEMVKNIRREIESSKADNELSETAHSWFLSCLIQPDEALARAKEEAGLDITQSQELKEMLDQTMDFLESPHCAAVLESALNTLFIYLLDDFYTEQLQSDTRPKSGISAINSASPSLGSSPKGTSAENIPHTIVSPVPSTATSDALTSEPVESVYLLAKVIAGIKLYSKHILATNEADSEEGSESVTTDFNRYVHKLENLPALEELSRAILGLSGDDDQSLEGLGDMKDLLPLLASLGGAGGKKNGQPDLSSLLPLITGQPNAPASDPSQLMNMLQNSSQDRATN